MSKKKQENDKLSSDDFDTIMRQITSGLTGDTDKDLSDRQFSDALAKQFNGRIYMYYEINNKILTEEIWHEELNKFKNFIKEKHIEQKNKIIESVESSFGLKYYDSEDIAAILYYTHLLGDHAGHSGKFTGYAVLEIDKILENLNEYIKDLARGTNYYIEYENNLKSVRQADERKDAESIIECLSNYIPKILKDKFESEFTNKNLQFVFEEKELLMAS